MQSVQSIRRAFLATGQVQGVGFRPFVYRLAQEGGLSGTVGNTSEGVRMEVQGPPQEVARFGLRLQKELPPLARLTALVEAALPLCPGEAAFAIVPSQGHSGHSVLVSPDVGLCPDCLTEMRTPGNRRQGYAFTNCTNCGPRYTITRSIPYDRATTSMHCFPLCAECAAEYGNPLDRRFHAQPIACPRCGPRLWLVDKAGLAAGGSTPSPQTERQALARAAELVRGGGILALKGLGGFQLACDARQAMALRVLRCRKTRPHKALSLMVADLATARSLCALAPEHEALLQRPEKPIVLCPRLAQAALPAEVAPDTRSLGLVLPNTPLHALLFDALGQGAGLPPVLVMTSANAQGEPLCLGNREALERLAPLADAWLLHNRDILVRVDDSVLAVLPPGVAAGQASAGGAAFPAAEGAEAAPGTAHDGAGPELAKSSGGPGASCSNLIFYRRARGYVPRPVFLPEAGPCVLGTGAELKSTLCLTRGAEAFVGQHVGDLENPATLVFFEEVAAHLEHLLDVRPKAIVCDLHPDFLSSRYAQARAAQQGLPLWTLQHHAAHAAAVLAENAHYHAALTLCLDGTGLGTDQTIWGGELLFMHLGAAHWERLGRLAPFALPGGEAAIREPWRVALSLQRRCGTGAGSLEQHPARPWLTPSQTPDSPPDYSLAARAVEEMLTRGVHCPLTSSCGRLFDAVAAQLGLCLATSYEGQAAIRLESAALTADFLNGAPGASDPLAAPSDWPVFWPASWPGLWPVPLAERQGLLEVDSVALFGAVLKAQAQGEAVARMAALFHGSLAAALAALAAEGARRTGCRHVGLSGGVLQNSLLSRLLPQALAARGLIPLCHHEVPPGDGGLSLGQAVWGRSLLARA